MQSSLEHHVNGALREAVTSDVRLAPIHGERLHDAALAPCFEAAALSSYGRARAEDLASGALLVFAVIDFGPKTLHGVVCVERVPTPGALVAHIAYVGLHPAAPPLAEGAWLVAMHQLAQHMGALGCSQIEYDGAPEIGRALGLEPTGAQFVVSLSRGARQ